MEGLLGFQRAARAGAIESDVAVRRVLDQRQVGVERERGQIVAPPRQQRAQHRPVARTYAGEPADAAAAVEPHNHRFELIVGVVRGRSEEHTSELQSLMRTSYAVFCLKNNTHNLK